MKQEKEKDPKVVVVGHSQSTPSTRLRGASPKPPKPDVSPAVAPGGLGAPGLKARSRSVPTNPSTDTNKVRRSLVLSKHTKSGEEVLMGHSKNEEVKTLGRSGNRQSVMEQFIRPKRRVNDLNESDREKKELQERVNSSENLVKSLQSEVVELKAELEKLRSFNVELESKNIQFAQDLAAAQEKISSFSSTHDQKDRASQKPQTSNFKDVQKLIAKKLENFVVTKSDGKEGRVPPPKNLKPVSSVVPVQNKVPTNSAPPTAMPPPPPPPPLPRVPTRVSAAKKAPSLVEFYHTLTKREERKDSLGPGIHSSRATNNAHNSIVGEIQNRSTHLLAIKQDVETKGEFIKSLIEKIQTAAYAEIEDVLKFVDWLDSQLSTLADERAVLKHFNWPERKADAMREAAIEYRDLKRLEIEVSSYKDDFSLPCEASLKKITGLLDKSERSIQRLIMLRESTKASYRECKIPTDWMLDSGMVYKIKQGSMKLAKLYMKRVSVELQSVRSSERESTQEALVLQGVRFAYRAHQFAGGLDSETMCAFEEIRQRVPTNMGGSRELLAGIVS